MIRKFNTEAQRYRVSDVRSKHGYLPARRVVNDLMEARSLRRMKRLPSASVPLSASQDASAPLLH